jgi:hypothetical protein
MSLYDRGAAASAFARLRLARKALRRFQPPNHGAIAM